MAEIQETSTGETDLATLSGRQAGRDKLEQAKARAFPPETKPQRIARASEALQQAKRIGTVDRGTLKYVAQSADLEVEALAPTCLKTRDILAMGLKATCDELRTEATLRYWNESVFRFFLIRNLTKAQPGIAIDCEWNDVDFAVSDGDGVSVVEIKFRPYRRLFGCKAHGGPSASDFRRVKKDLSKLETMAFQPWALAAGGITSAFLILLYVDPLGESGLPTYAQYYDGILVNDSVRW